MPVIILERIPLPSLQTYSAFSIVLLSCALFYAHQIVTNVDSENIGVGIGGESATSKQHVNPSPPDAGPRDVSPAPGPDVLGVGKRGAESLTPGDYDYTKPENGDEFGSEDFEETLNYTLPYDNYVGNMFHVMTVEIWCVWTLINMAYCCLILMGKVIQKVVFGELRVSELQHLKDKFWNFVFYKFIFIFGVMNVQTMEEVVLWVAWFTMLGFFHLLTQLCKDRFEYLSFSPTTPKLIHVKLLSLLFCILLCCSGLMVVCALTGLQAGITIFSFMTAECLLLGIRALYVVVRYAIHLWDMNLEGVWENRSIMIYYTELVFELAALSIDFGHHLHMLLWGNIFLSMASLVICMQLRYLFYEFQRRIKRHKNYLRVVRNMESRFTMASKEDLEKNNDDCAICWEKMELARKLPCGHLFHNSCLRSWLEQDTSCPTCRMSLTERPEGDPNGNNVDGRGDAANNMPPQPQNNAATTNHFFHFDGSRYVSWLPSFSVEVTHTQLLPGRHADAVHTSQLDNMARQVHGVFQHMPLNVILDDLRLTRSVDDTIDNILEGRLLAPPTGTFPPRLPTDRDPTGTDPDSTAAGDMDRQVLPSTVSSTGATALRAELSARSGNVYETLVGPDDEQGPEVTRGRSVSNLMGNYSAEMDNSRNAMLSTSYREDLPSATGSRFSKSSTERETMLQDRKNALLEQARRRYLSAANLGSSSENSQHTQFASPDSSPYEEFLWGRGEGRLDQRELVFRAAQRRLQQQLPLD